MNGAAGTGVLVIVAGGNIGLYAKEVNKDWGVRPVPLKELEALVIAATVAPEASSRGTLVLRENSENGVSIRVEFEKVESGGEKNSEAEDLDSAQLDPARWEKIANIIEERQEKYEGFVILHGLDTMAYTASALSFMLGQLNVPIVLTGAQRPLNFGRTDALQNIISSIAIAAGGALGIHPIMQEVCVYSHDTLFRGNRVTMTSSSSYRSFDSPNYPALAVAGENIEIQDNVVWRSGLTKRGPIRGAASAQVEVIDVFPGMNPARVASLSEERVSDLRDQEIEGERSELRGVLLRTYGMGTAPTSPKFLAALKDLVDAKIAVMSVTQARSGRISHGTDPVSVRLMEQGVISGGDMTAEAAYAKMVVLLSQSDDAAEVADKLQIALCGEQSQNTFNVHYGPGETEEAGEEEEEEDSLQNNLGCTAFLSQEKIVEKNALIQEDVTHIQLRLLGIRPADTSRNMPLNDLRVYLTNTQDRGERPDEEPHIQETLRWDNGPRETINLVKDVTELVEQYILQPGQLTVRLETTHPISWSRASLTIFSTVRLSGV